MSGSFSSTASETFSIIHARHIASKVATDLKRIQRFYGGVPADSDINDYEAELVELLKHDVVADIIYGFKRDGRWTEVVVRYKALAGGTLSTDDDPGKIRPGLDVANATFCSFLAYNRKWDNLSTAEQAAIRKSCPFQRSSGSSPPLEAGYWADDLKYSAGGRGLGRSTVRR